MCCTGKYINVSDTSMSKSLVLVGHSKPTDLMMGAQFEKYIEMSVEYMIGVPGRHLV